jgi:hypothetical protein
MAVLFSPLLFIGWRCVGIRRSCTTFAIFLCIYTYIYEPYARIYQDKLNSGPKESGKKTFHMDIFVPIIATNVAAILLIGAMAFGGKRGAVPRTMHYVGSPSQQQAKGTTTTSTAAAAATPATSTTAGTTTNLSNVLKNSRSAINSGAPVNLGSLGSNKGANGSSGMGNNSSGSSGSSSNAKSLENLLQSSMSEIDTLKKAVNAKPNVSSPSMLSSTRAGNAKPNVSSPSMLSSYNPSQPMYG